MARRNNSQYIKRRKWLNYRGALIYVVYKTLIVVIKDGRVPVWVPKEQVSSSLVININTS